MILSFQENKAKPLLTNRLNSLNMNIHISLMVILMMKTFKYNNLNIYAEIFSSVVMFAFEFQLFYKCSKCLLMIKLNAPSKRRLSRRLQSVIKRVSVLLQTNDMKTDLTEYQANFKGFQSIEGIPSKLIIEQNSNNIKDQIIEYQQQQHENLEIIKILYYEIEKLKKIINNLNRENEHLKQNKIGTSDNIMMSPFSNQRILSSPTSSENLLNFHSKNHLQKIEIYSQVIQYETQESIDEVESFKWPIFLKKIQENINDFRIIAIKKSMNSNNELEKEGIGFVQKDYKHVTFKFVNESQENLNNVKLTIRSSES